MSNILSVVEGWTGLLGPFTLRADGNPIDLSGFTVAMILKDSFGNVVAHGGTVTVLNQITNPGQVTYEPVSTDFIFSPSGNTGRQPYTIRWKVTDGTGDVIYFPNNVADEIGVYKQ